MDDQSKQLISQLGQMAIQAYFSWMTMSGKTEEEIHQDFILERAKFIQRSPDTLPKPPG